MALGNLIKKHRKAKGMNITKLAKLTGISRSYLSQIESGAKGPPSVKVLLRIAESLSIPTAEILNIAEDKDLPQDYIREVQSHNEIHNIITRTFNITKDSADYAAQHQLKDFSIIFLEDKEADTKDIQQLQYNPLLIENILLDLMKMGEQGQRFVKKQIEVYREFFTEADERSSLVAEDGARYSVCNKGKHK